MDWWPFNDDGPDLPRSSADLGFLDGSPPAMRASAVVLRAVVTGLAPAEKAAAKLERVKQGETWNGEAFATFRTALDKAPTTVDVANAKSTMGLAAGVLERLADGMEDTQGRWEGLRKELDGLGVPPSGDIPDDLKPKVQSVASRARTELHNYKVYFEAAARDFDTYDDKPRFAKDKAGADYWLRATLHAVGDFFEGVWDAFKELGGALKSLWDLRKISTWDDKWDSFWKTMQLAADDPLGFAKQLGLTAIDWETLKENPAKWLGKLAPSLVAAFFTGGATVALTRGGKLADQLAELGRSVRALEALRRRQRRIDGFGGDGDGDATGEIDLTELLRLDKKVNEYMDLAKLINPSGDMSNCVRCVVAFEMAIRAKQLGLKNIPKISARSGHPGYNRQQIAEMLGGKFKRVKSFSDIEKEILAGGPGTRGVVAGAYPRGPGADLSQPGKGHVFSVMNIDGTVVYIDPQTGMRATSQFKLDPKSFEYMTIPKEHQ